jgi:hypothetical protein
MCVLLQIMYFSSVSIVSDYRLDDQGSIAGRGKGKDCFSNLSVQTGYLLRNESEIRPMVSDFFCILLQTAYLQGMEHTLIPLEPYKYQPSGK